MDWLLTSVSASLAISDNGKSQINSEIRELLIAVSVIFKFVPKNALIVFSSALSCRPKLSEVKVKL